MSSCRVLPLSSGGSFYSRKDSGFISHCHSFSRLFDNNLPKRPWRGREHSTPRRATRHVVSADTARCVGQQPISPISPIRPIRLIRPIRPICPICPIRPIGPMCRCPQAYKKPSCFGKREGFRVNRAAGLFCRNGTELLGLGCREGFVPEADFSSLYGFFLAVLIGKEEGTGGQLPVLRNSR